MVSKLILLLLSISIIFKESAAGESDDGTNLLIKLIEAMKAKIDKLEDMEATMKQSIGAIVSTTAQFRVKFDELEKRLAECESRCNIKGEVNEDDTKVYGHDQCEKRNNVRRQVPEQVAFSAYLDHVSRDLAKNQAIIYNQVLYNQAGAYHPTTGIFTVPTSGVYLFSWSVTARRLHNEHSYDIWVKLVVNGNHKLGAVAESRDDSEDNQGSNTVILKVNQGDNVWVVHYGGTDIYGDDYERTSSFSGVLLYFV